MKKSSRLQSLDIFRGLTVAAMIWVNNPGSWSYIYPPFEHASWHGCTPTDLIFPFFIFIVGVSIRLAYDKRKSAGDLGISTYKKVIIRSAKLIFLGITLSFLSQLLRTFPEFDWRILRLMNVLARIGLVFFISTIIFLNTTVRTQIGIFVALLVGYWIMMTQVPVPGFGESNLVAGTNFAAWFDRLFLNEHMWAASKNISPNGELWDPEGLFSTLPAIATGISGILTGHLLKRQLSDLDKIVRMFVYGFVLIVAGLTWDLSFPMNKALWTSSFVLYTSGLALHVFACCYWIIDVKKFDHKSLEIFKAYGANAITVFFGSGILIRILMTIKIGDQSVLTWLNYTLIKSWITEPYLASAAHSLMWVMLFSFPLIWMYRKNIIIKV